MTIGQDATNPILVPQDVRDAVHLYERARAACVRAGHDDYPAAFRECVAYEKRLIKALRRHGKAVIVGGYRYTTAAGDLERNKYVTTRIVAKGGKG